MSHSSSLDRLHFNGEAKGRLNPPATTPLCTWQFPTPSILWQSTPTLSDAKRWTVKHASEQTLNSISEFLDGIRSIEGLKERKLGVFYRKSRAFLHFHEDGGKIFADVRLKEPEFERFPSSTERERARLLGAIIRSLSIDSS